MTPIVEIRAVSKGFPGVQALSSVSLDLRAGEIHAVIGENGAGKSTLMNMLAGELQPDSGAIAIDGRGDTNSQPAGRPGHGDRCGLSRTVAVPEHDRRRERDADGSGPCARPLTA